MILELKRLHDDGDTTLGAMYADGIFQCFIVEDQEQTQKVFGETRIPNGEFDVSLRAEGGFHNRYSSKFGQSDGMLCIHNAPDWKIIVDDIVFQFVLIHIGNDDGDTAGCLLPNSSFDTNTMRGGGSTIAYRALYAKVHRALKAGEKVKIRITDIEPGK